jgi:hypothetical protein
MSTGDAAVVSGIPLALAGIEITDWFTGPRRAVASLALAAHLLKAAALLIFQLLAISLFNSSSVRAAI